MAKYKIGDEFARKHTRDRIPLKITNVIYESLETVYELTPIILCGNTKTMGEAALDELYYKIE